MCVEIRCICYNPFQHTNIVVYFCFFLPDGHSLTFSGSGYVKYHLMENENKELMRLSLKLRTFSTHATVMYARGTDYSILEVRVCCPPNIPAASKPKQNNAPPSCSAQTLLTGPKNPFFKSSFT